MKPEGPPVAARRDALPERLRRGLEVLSGFDLSGVRVHRDSPEPARIDALAYTAGRDIHLAPGAEAALPHEAWHSVQQMQGRVAPEGFRFADLAINADRDLEAEADRMGARAWQVPWFHPVPAVRQHPAALSTPVAQRAVRINGGAARINEAQYRPGGSRATVGSRYSVASLIGDSVRRVFNDVTELENYANGRTDYIGDVATSGAGTFWYRLPPAQLTVLGEAHSNPQGNTEDVILGLRTSRFMYEAYNAMTPAAGISSFPGTEARMTQVHAARRTAPQVDRTRFDPSLENIVIKGLTGCAIYRNEFLPAGPRTMGASEQRTWGSRASTSGYSYGERCALYVSMAIHIAKDLSLHDFGPPNFVESLYVSSARALADFYRQHQADLDRIMNRKDGDDLIGILDLLRQNFFNDLQLLEDFSIVFHEYGSRYVEQLGIESGSRTLQTEGRALAGNLGARVRELGPAREEIMWQRVLQARTNGYLLVGMGEAHRQSLQSRLSAAGIANEEVAHSLARQAAAVNAGWAP